MFATLRRLFRPVGSTSAPVASLARDVADEVAAIAVRDALSAAYGRPRARR